MKRRDLLRSAALTALVASWPPFLRAAFATDGAHPACTEDEARDVAAGLARARRRGKALLVLVVPTNPDERRPRGVYFGELINHGSDVVLALLATVEVACARPAAIACVAPAFERMDESPLMLLIEPTASGSTVTPLHVDLVAVARVAGPPPRTFADQRMAEEAEGQARIAALTELLRNALAGADLDRRAQENAHAFSDSKRARLAAASPDELARLPLDHVDRAAPILLARVWQRHGHATAQPVLARLADAARRRIRDQPVPGSRWVRLTGCDEMIEGEEREEGAGGFACGMGGVPTLSARFLRFLVDLEPPAS